MHVTVRAERPDDLVALQHILQSASFHDSAADLGPATRDSDVLVPVTDAGEIVGMLKGGQFEDYAERIAEHVPPPQTWVSIMAVAPQHRRNGVGRALLAAAARAGKAAGSTFVVCMVAEHDENAGRMAFFRNCGLNPVIPEHDDVMAGSIAQVLAACEHDEE